MSFRMFACAACGKIMRGKRSQAITCSDACRVRFHRHPELRASLETASRALGLSVACLLERRALATAHPDLAERIDAGEISIGAVRVEAERRMLRRMVSQFAANQRMRNLGDR